MCFRKKDIDEYTTRCNLCAPRLIFTDQTCLHISITLYLFGKDKDIVAYSFWTSLVFPVICFVLSFLTICVFVIQSRTHIQLQQLLPEYMYIYAHTRTSWVGWFILRRIRSAISSSVRLSVTASNVLEASHYHTINPVKSF